MRNPPKVIIDGDKIFTLKRFFEAFYDAFFHESRPLMPSFLMPHCYDSLNDALHDIEQEYPDGVIIWVRHAAKLKSRLGYYDRPHQHGSRVKVYDLIKRVILDFSDRKIILIED